MRRLTLLGLLLALSGFAHAQVPGPDAAFDHFWAAATVKEATDSVGDVMRSGVSFEDAYQRLKRGRRYTAQKTGMIRLAHDNHYYTVTVPENYDPAKKYQVRVQLHGGVMMRHSNMPPANAGGIGALAGVEQIYIVPFAWDAAAWWTDDQLSNLDAILDRAKRDLNVDENRVVLSGVSDGGTGVYYTAMRDTTPFAAFLPLNGFMMVLGASDLIVDGPLYPNNMRNKPFFIVNGTKDPLYPTRLVEPYIDHYKAGGVTLDYRPQEAAHNTSWWPQVKDTYEAFVHDHPRNPYPDTLTWETADVKSRNRAHWLVIDKLGHAKDELQSLPDLNDYVGPAVPDFGVRTSGNRINRVLPGSNAEKIGLKAGDVLMHLNDVTLPYGVDLVDALADVKPGATISFLVARNNEPKEIEGKYDPQVVKMPPKQLFDRSQPWGRVDLVRDGNTVRATTRGVIGFTLLLSPDQFDFSKPVTVVANGRTVFNAKVQKDRGTLMKYAAIDNDRTMLFGAELHIDLTK
ncbi:MAG TPA: PDZ domain-containing protein [Vicinamibacterales bacterium]|nr:PDZ domain-containing protein [Vicinamibacterales bacterium]